MPLCADEVDHWDQCFSGLLQTSPAPFAQPLPRWQCWHGCIHPQGAAMPLAQVGRFCGACPASPRGVPRSGSLPGASLGDLLVPVGAALPPVSQIRASATAPLSWTSLQPPAGTGGVRGLLLPAGPRQAMALRSSPVLCWGCSTDEGPCLAKTLHLWDCPLLAHGPQATWVLSAEGWSSDGDPQSSGQSSRGVV